MQNLYEFAKLLRVKAMPVQGSTVGYDAYERVRRVTVTGLIPNPLVQSLPFSPNNPPLTASSTPKISL